MVICPLVLIVLVLMLLVLIVVLAMPLKLNQGLMTGERLISIRVGNELRRS